MGLKLYLIFGITGAVALLPLVSETFKILVQQGEYDNFKYSNQTMFTYKTFVLMSIIDIVFLSWPINLINLIIGCFERKNNNNAI